MFDSQGESCYLAQFLVDRFKEREGTGSGVYWRGEIHSES
jgi:hypothetical protein